MREKASKSSQKTPNKLELNKILSQNSNGKKNTLLTAPPNQQNQNPVTPLVLNKAAISKNSSDVAVTPFSGGFGGRLQQSSSKALQTPCSEISDPDSHDHNNQEFDDLDEIKSLNSKIKEDNIDKRPPSEKELPNSKPARGRSRS